MPPFTRIWFWSVTLTLLVLGFCMLGVVSSPELRAGIIQAIIPQAVPTANKRGNSTIFALATNATPATAGTLYCDDGSGNTTTSGCPGAGGGIGNITPVTVSANTTADQTLQELSLTAGFLNGAAQQSLIVGSGIFTIGAAQTPTLAWKVKLCTVSGCGSGTVVTLATMTTTATIAATNNPWNINLTNVGTHVTGATGNLIVHGFLSIDLAASAAAAETVFNDANTAASGNIDLTAALFVDFTVATSTGSATNSFTQQNSGAYIGAGSAPSTLPNGFFLAASGKFYIGPTFQQATLPVAGNFAWVNQGGATETSSGNALVLAAPAGSGFNLRIRETAIGGNSTLTVNLSCTSQVQEFGICGIGFRESATGKLVTLHYVSVNGVGSNELEVDHWSDPSTPSSVFDAAFVPWVTQWAQLQITGGNINFLTSADGVNFVQHYTEAQNAFFTTAPDQWFYFANATTSGLTQPVTATLFSYNPH